MTPEEYVNQALADIAAIEDPVERFNAATEAVELARTTFMQGARKIRQDTVNELRNERHMTLKGVGELLGRHRNHIQQISEGRTGGKPKAAAAKDSDKG